VRRVVVKVGSAVLAPRGELEAPAVESLAGQIDRARGAGLQVILVSSGAVASGFRALGLAAPPKTIVLKQASAAVGQQRLMAAYASAFTPRGVAVGQVLLTAEDFTSRVRYLNARRTLQTLLEHGAVPIINENDSVAVDEIKLGDNDNLSALVASLVNADLLLILSTVEGLYDSFVKGRPGSVVREVTPETDVDAFISSDTSSVGTGGMVTKVRAARLGAKSGFATVIASGSVPDVIARVLGGEVIGTRFTPEARSMASRKRWIGYSAKPKGVIVVDDGARRAITSRGASLLPGGVVSVSGSFEQGAPVEIRGRDGKAFARGLSLYASSEIARIKGKKSGQIAAVLGDAYADEIVHRDDLVVKEQA
jgi:glutamate 5-kinase